MTHARGRPLTALIAVLCLWVSARAWEWSRVSLEAPPKAKHTKGTESRPPGPIGNPTLFVPILQQGLAVMRRQTSLTPKSGYAIAPYAPAISYAPPVAALLIAKPIPSGEDATAPATEAAPRLVSQVIPPTAPMDRWSLSAWSILRPGRASTSSIPSGQLGGSQIGARLVYRLWQPTPASSLNAYGRLSAPVQTSSGREAAIGVSAKTLKPIPIELGVERRIALSRGGRSAWTLIASGGISDKVIAKRIILNGYAQAGLVGLHKRDGFADGEAVISYQLPVKSKSAVELGIGIWGAVQPRISRIDAGPSVTVRPVIAGTRYRISAQWREAISGNARPGSGPALVIGADF